MMSVEETVSLPPTLGVRRREAVLLNGFKRHGSIRYSVTAQSMHIASNDREMEWNASEWDSVEQKAILSNKDAAGYVEELVEVQDGGSWKMYSTAKEKARASNARAQAAEVAAGVAAAQAVAALRIAEEARAEAEAAKKVAEASMNEGLERRVCQTKPEFLDERKLQPGIMEKERDELKARLEEIERKLQEKTRRVSELEYNLEEVTHYFLEFKAMIEGSKSDTLAISDEFKEDVASSERGDTTSAESSGWTVMSNGVIREEQRVKEKIEWSN